MKGPLIAKLSAGASQGLADAQQHERERPIRDLRLQEAKLQQQKAQMEFDEYSAAAPDREAKRDAEVAQANLLAHSATTQILRDQTFQSFRQYDADGDTRHLNNFLKTAKNNPVGKDLYSNLLRVEPVTSGNSWEVKKLFHQAGYENPDEIMNSPELAKDFVVALDASGNLSLVSITGLKAATGYNQYMTQQELIELEKRAQIENLLKGPKSAETTLIRDVAKSFKEQNPEATDYEAYVHALGVVKQSGSSQRSSALERIAERIKANNPGISDEEAIRQAKQLTTAGTEAEREARRLHESGQYKTYEAAFDAVTNRREQTSTMRNANAVQDLRKQIDELSGGSLFELDMANTADRRKIQPYIAQLEQLSGREMSTEDKRVARDLRDLHALGATAAEELTPQETGLIDNMLSSVKKYTSDLGGKKSVAAYETFRNIFRNSLYGASLTATEISNFNKAAGTLGQQLGPVLQQMQVQVESIRNQMQAIYDLNDEYVAYYYVGADLESLDRTIEALDQRLDMIRKQAGSTKLANMTPAQIREQQLQALPAAPSEPVRSEEEDMELMRRLRTEGQ